MGGSTQGIASRSCETKRHCKPADEPGLSGRSSSRSGQDGFSIGFSAPFITWNLIACAARVVIIFWNSRFFGEQNISGTAWPRDPKSWRVLGELTMCFLRSHSLTPHALLANAFPSGEYDGWTMS